jgi:hypothetical protein
MNLRGSPRSRHKQKTCPAVNGQIPYLWLALRDTKGGEPARFKRKQARSGRSERAFVVGRTDWPSPVYILSFCSILSPAPSIFCPCIVWDWALARLPAGSFMNSVLASSLPKQ